MDAETRTREAEVLGFRFLRSIIAQFRRRAYMDPQQEKQEQIIRILAAKLAALKCSQFAFDRFLQELKRRKEFAILDLLRVIQDSREVGEVYAAGGTAPDAIVSAALGTMRLDEVEELIQHIVPEVPELK
jgi:hypothetical protein